MAERIDFRVDPGVRLVAALRGPRLSLGPRIDRFDVDGRRAADVPDPDARWATLAGGGLLPEPPVTGRRARRRKAQEWQTVHDHLVRVQSVHERPVARAAEPRLDPPDVDPDALRTDLKQEATDGLGALDLAGRWRARKATRPHLDDAVEQRQADLHQAAADERQQLADWWQALEDNDPDVVRRRLHHAFEQHRFAAAVTAVESDRAHLVIPVAKPISLVGDREPTTEAGGARTLPKMTKERRHAVYEAAIASGALSTAAEAFAVCPGLGRVAMAIIAPEHVGGPAILLFIEVTRDLVLPDDADRSAISSVHDVEAAEPRGLGRVVIDRGEVSGALRRFDPDHPDVAPILSVLEAD